MCRLARRVFTLCSWLSLLLCIVCAGMNLRSHRVQDAIIWARTGASLAAVQSHSGKLSVTRAGGWPQDRDLRWTRLAGSSIQGEWAGWPAANMTVAHLPGVWVSRGSGWFGRWNYPAAGGPLHPVTMVTVRWDALFLLVAVPPAALAMRRIPAALRRRALARVGLCRSCGYDLRASPERCPECGTLPAGKANA